VADIVVRNDTQQEGYIYDSYGLEGVKGASFFSFHLIDFRHSVYSSSTFPVEVTELSAFQLGPARPKSFGDFDLQFAFKNSCCITGEARGTTQSVSSTVPEPGSLTLAALGFVALCLNRRSGTVFSS
jgi:hypothetical protein